jgi:hypothetical protein
MTTPAAMNPRDFLVVDYLSINWFLFGFDTVVISGAEQRI